jgi:hypothetical protein
MALPPIDAPPPLNELLELVAEVEECVATDDGLPADMVWTEVVP